MNTKRLLIFLSLIVLVLAGYYYKANSWITYKEEGKFQVLFPNTPRRVVTNIPFRSESELIPYTNYVARGSDDTLYFLTMAIYPITPSEEEGKQYLINFLYQLTQKSRQNKVIKQEPTTYHGQPALDFTLLNDKLWTQGRAILAGNKMFVLLASSDNFGLVQNNFHTFANSLEIK